MEQNNDKKEKQVENLVNLVEKHTRTERHLEQYSNIGSREGKERARDKQDVREEEIDKLKNKIVSNNTESKTEQVQNLSNNYKGAQIYMEENYEKMPEERLQNMQNRQQHRKDQLESLSENIYDEEN
ncbi:MAG: hypothetical protein J6A29_04550 [Clostridia bacterium]|nr:hypothetical protein [Clostridia bacterium]